MSKVIVITGPTACGKSKFAIELAKEINGEIVNADSVQVYKDFNIASAKPSEEDYKKVKHHLYSFVDPEENFNAYNYSEEAKRVVEELAQQSKIPILVGGTGLYIQGFLEGFNFKGEEELAAPAKNEVTDKLELEFLVIILLPKREILYDKINKRVEKMFSQGLVKELKTLRKSYSLNAPPFGAIGYRQAGKYLDNMLSLEAAIDTIQRDTRRFAKRQMTWWRNQPEKYNWNQINFSDLRSDMLLAEGELSKTVLSRISLSEKEVLEDKSISTITKIEMISLVESFISGKLDVAKLHKSNSATSDLCLEKPCFVRVDFSE